MNRVKINRVNHGVTILYNDVFENENLTWTAKGIYAYIASKGACYMSELEMDTKTSKRELNKAIRQLLEYGYTREVDGGYELNV